MLLIFDSCNKKLWNLFTRTVINRIIIKHFPVHLKNTSPPLNRVSEWYFSIARVSYAIFAIDSTSCSMFCCVRSAVVHRQLLDFKCTTIISRFIQFTSASLLSITLYIIPKWPNKCGLSSIICNWYNTLGCMNLNCVVFRKKMYLKKC